MHTFNKSAGQMKMKNLDNGKIQSRAPASGLIVIVTKAEFKWLKPEVTFNASGNLNLHNKPVNHWNCQSYKLDTGKEISGLPVSSSFVPTYLLLTKKTTW